MRKYLLGFFVLVNVYCFKVVTIRTKPPRTDGSGQENSSQDENPKIDREFARELAREFGREFAREFAPNERLFRSIKFEQKDMEITRNQWKVLAGGFRKSAPIAFSLFGGCFEFYEKHPDCFSISSIDNLPQNLNWQTEVSDMSLLPLKQKKVEHGKSLRDFSYSKNDFIQTQTVQ